MGFIIPYESMGYMCCKEIFLHLTDSRHKERYCIHQLENFGTHCLNSCEIQGFIYDWVTLKNFTKFKHTKIEILPWVYIYSLHGALH